MGNEANGERRNENEEEQISKQSDRNIVNLTVANINCNSLFKVNNIEYISNNQSESRDDKQIYLKNNFLNELLQDKDVTVVTDTRLNKFDRRDLSLQLKKHIMFILQQI